MTKTAFVLAAVALVGALALVGCEKLPLAPTMPWADVVNDSLCFFTVGTDPGGLKVCYVFDWGNGSTTTTGYFASGDTGYCSREFADTRVRYIRAMARNEKGVESDWSPSLRFRLSEPPGLADTFLGLQRWVVERWYRPSVSITDPDGDSVAAKFVWDDSIAGSWSAFVPSGSVVTDSCKWSEVGPHTVKVVLKDRGCTVSRPSTVKTVGVSKMAVVWGTCDNSLVYNATPTLGLIDGEPLLYCVSGSAVDCYRLDGRRRWSVSIPGGSGYAPSLSADGGRLYSAGSNSLECLDAHTGQRIWSLAETTSSSIRCTPALGPDNSIYVLVGKFWYRELRRVRDCGDSAVIEWRLTIGYDHGPVDYGPVVGRNGVVYAIGYGGSRSSLFAVDSSGSVLWKDSARIQMGGFPVIDGRDRILVTDQGGYLYCFNPDGTLAWSISTGIRLCAGSTAIGFDDEVIVTDWDRSIHNYDSDGQLRWKSVGCTYGDNTPCVARDSTTIAFDVENDRVCAISYSGQTLWEFSIMDSLGIDKRRSSYLEGNGCNSALIGPNGDLYLATAEGLVCIAHGGLSMSNAAWPTYNHDNAHSGWAGRQQR